MNKVFLIGNLVRDPEVRATQSGISVCNFTVAVNRRFKKENGEQETDFLNVIAWRQLAELCSKYLAKGRKVAVTGSIQTRTYEAKDGSKRTAWDIVADEVEFLSPQNQQSSTQSAPGAYTTAASKDSGTAYAPQPHNDFGGFTQVDDEELPF
jgi:single-strand DNA-binding protein